MADEQHPPSRPVALVAVLVAVVVLGLAFAAYAHWAGNATYIGDVELAGSSKVVAGIVKNHSDRYVHALYVDFGFIAGANIIPHVQVLCDMLPGEFDALELAFAPPASDVQSVAS